MILGGDSQDPVNDFFRQGATNFFANDLAEWAIQQNINHAAINSLLGVLRKHTDPKLPVDARTLLKTPRSISTITPKCGGNYVYFGIEAGIARQNLKSVNEVKLIVNVDGLPLFKSSGTQVWPILGKLEKGKPFIIAMFCGNGKPNSESDFMSDFLREATKLKKNGLNLPNKSSNNPFEIKYFICDAPARQLLKCIKGHIYWF